MNVTYRSAKARSAMSVDPYSELQHMRQHGGLNFIIN